MRTARFGQRNRIRKIRLRIVRRGIDAAAFPEHRIEFQIPRPMILRLQAIDVDAPTTDR